MAKSKYEDHVKPRFDDIQRWLKEGLTQKQIARSLGVCVATFEEHKKKYPELVALLKAGRKPFIEELRNALAKRALGFEHDDVETQIRDEGGRLVKTVKKVTKYYPPDVGACAILLKNMDKGNWSDNPAMVQLRREILEFEKQKFEKGQW